MCYNSKFNKWFSKNYLALKEKCLPYNLFGELYNTTFEDIFHDAYLVCVESTKVCKDSTLFETIFVATFKAQNKVRYNAEMRNIRPTDLFWSFLKSEDYDVNENESKKEKRSAFVKALKQYAKNSFSADEYTLFCLYFNNGLSQYEIADVFGSSRGAVLYRLTNIKNLLCMRFNDEIKNL